ncbi:hypothetical protein [Wolbachia endosymbiont of Protocalliphora sialia]
MGCIITAINAGAIQAAIPPMAKGDEVSKLNHQANTPSADTIL